MDKSKFNQPKEWKKFGIALSILLSVIGTIQLIFDKTLYPYFYGIAVVLLLSSLILPKLIRPLFILFSYVGYAINWLMTRIILSLLFYIVFTLIHLINKLAGKTFLDLKIDKQAASYWISREEIANKKEQYEKQF